MIGLLDLTEHDRRVLRDVTFGRLVWFPVNPPDWGRVALLASDSVWVWLDDSGFPLSDATAAQVAAVYRLQRAGLVRPTHPGSVTVTTAAGMRLITALDADGWQPPDRAPLAIAATVRKATPRPRKKRAS